MVKRAGFVIFRQTDVGIEYLMVKSTKVGQHWTPPKGRLDDGEDDFSAALRETQEEVGYVADDLEIYSNQIVTVEQKLTSDKVTFFLARLKNTDKIPTLSEEHSEYRWVNEEQAAALYGTQSDLFKEYGSNISNNQLV